MVELGPKMVQGTAVTKDAVELARNSWIRSNPRRKDRQGRLRCKLMESIEQSVLIPTRAEKSRRADVHLVRNYCSGIGGRGTLLSPDCGGSCVGAGGGM